MHHTFLDPSNLLPTSRVAKSLHSEEPLLFLQFIIKENGKKCENSLSAAPNPHCSRNRNEKIVKVGSHSFVISNSDFLLMGFGPFCERQRKLENFMDIMKFKSYALNNGKVIFNAKND